MPKKRKGKRVFDPFTLEMAARQINTLLQGGVLNRNRTGDVTFQAATTQVLICLNDLLQAASDRGKRVGFTDDVGYVFGTPCDVTTLINDARNAACHLLSGNRVANTAQLDFVTITCPTAIVVGPPEDEIEIRCAYEDDWVFGYGPLTVYVRRHLVRAYDEAVKALGLRFDVT